MPFSFTGQLSQFEKAAGPHFLDELRPVYSGQGLLSTSKDWTEPELRAQVFPQVLPNPASRIGPWHRAG